MLRKAPIYVLPVPTLRFLTLHSVRNRWKRMSVKEWCNALTAWSQNTCAKFVLVSLSPPWIQHGLAWDRTRISVVREPVWHGNASSYRRKEKGRGKDKVVPALKHYIMKAVGRMEIRIHGLWTSAPNGGKWSAKRRSLYS